MYALITRDLTTILKERANVVPIPKEQLAPNKGYWVPINVITVDNSTQRHTVNTSEDVIYEDRVDRTVTISDKPQNELDDIHDRMSDAFIDSLVGLVLYDVMTGAAPVPASKAEYKNYIVSKL